MKNLFIALGLVLLIGSPAFAQSQKEIMKERMELQKLTRSALKEKASKDARKEAKRLQKALFIPSIGLVRTSIVNG